MQHVPDPRELDEAYDRIRPHVHHTPVVTSTYFDARLNTQLFFKCENFQKGGAFKFRGATNAVLSLSDEDATNGVCTHSSGNHAQALALAARARGIPAHIVMPENAPRVKQDAVAGYGGRITLCEPTLDARESTARRIVESTDATFIPPYDDSRIIAGAASSARELLDDAGPLDAIIVPVGGGGQLSGAALTAHFRDESIAVYGAEPAGADDAYRSVRLGELVPSVDPTTIADGLLTSLSDLTFSIIRQHVADIIVVDDQEIAAEMRNVWERMKLVIEPSAAVGVAAAVARSKVVAGKRVGIILTGGNVDLDRLPWLAGDQRDGD